MTNPFNAAAKKAETGSLARRIKAEGAMAKALVQAILDRGYSVTINDGEDDVGIALTDADQAVSFMFSTDEDWVYAVRDGEIKAWFFMVYGNSGYDVVSDYTANALGDDIWDNVLRGLSDELERELT